MKTNELKVEYPNGRRPYSYNAMKETVDMCYKRTSILMTIDKIKKQLQPPYIKDRGDYIFDVLESWAANALFYIICLAISAIVFGSGGLKSIVIGFVISVLIGYGIKIGSANNKYNEIREAYLIKKIDYEKKEPALKNGLIELNERLSECENMLQDRTKYVFSKDYWDCAGELIYYIDNDRADNVKEAINIHHQMLHENRINNIVNSVYQTAINTQNIAQEAAYQAYMGRIAAESAAQSARNAEFLSWINLLQ